MINYGWRSALKKAALVFLMFALTLAAACAPVYESRVDYAMGAEVTQKIWGAGEDCAKEALAEIPETDLVKLTVCGEVEYNII